MRCRRKRDLCISDVLPCHGRAEFVGDQLEVFGRLEAAGDGYVDLDEVIEISVGEPPAQTVLGIRRQIHTIASCQGEKRRRLDRAFQMNMELGFGGGAQVRLERHSDL